MQVYMQMNLHKYLHIQMRKIVCMCIYINLQLVVWDLDRGMWVEGPAWKAATMTRVAASPVRAIFLWTFLGVRAQGLEFSHAFLCHPEMVVS